MIRLKENYKLIGDVNLFFQEDEVVEINLMISGKGKDDQKNVLIFFISDSKYRGKGIAKEVLDLIIKYSNSI